MCSVVLRQIFPMKWFLGLETPPPSFPPSTPPPLLLQNNFRQDSLCVHQKVHNECVAPPFVVWTALMIIT